jgi:hypothetical protein
MHGRWHPLHAHSVYCVPRMQVIVAQIYGVHEQWKCRDQSHIKAHGRCYIMDVLCRVAEGRHFEGANIVGAFGTQVAPYVKLVRGDA